MKELIGSHSGQNMAEVTADVLEDYGITNRVGYIMSDNVYANDTYVRHLSTLLEARGLCFDPSQRRLRCQGHIINLVVMSFFFDPIPTRTLIRTSVPPQQKQTNGDGSGLWVSFITLLSGFKVAHREGKSSATSPLASTSAAIRKLDGIPTMR